MADAYRVTIRVPTAGEKWRLVPLGDVHKGAPGHARDTLRADVKMIRDTPNCYWIGMGDYIDCITHNDRKRFNPKHFKGSDYTISDLANLPKIQTEEFLHEVEPIKDKCLGLIEGNHEWQNPKFNSFDPMTEIVKAIGAPFLGVSGFLKIRVVDDVKSVLDAARYTFSVWAHHGFGGGRLAGGHALALQRLVMQAQGVNCYLMGHRHANIIFPTTATYASDSVLDNGDEVSAMHSCERVRIRDFPVVTLMTGSYLLSYRQGTSDYAEQNGYPPGIMGAPWVDVWGRNLCGANGRQVGYVPVYQATHTPLVGGGLLVGV